MEIVAGVLAFVYRRDIEKFLSDELMTGIRQHYPRESEADPEGLRAAWAFIQTEVRLHFLLACCAWNLRINMACKLPDIFYVILCMKTIVLLPGEVLLDLCLFLRSYLTPWEGLLLPFLYVISLIPLHKLVSTQ